MDAVAKAAVVLRHVHVNMRFSRFSSGGDASTRLASASIRDLERGLLTMEDVPFARFLGAFDVAVLFRFDANMRAGSALRLTTGK